MLWDASNVLTWYLRRSTSSYTRIRYEDFVRNPAATIRPLLAHLNADPPPADWMVKPDLEPHHTVAGNPMRFRSGPLDLREDDAWKHSMRALDRLGVTALTWPLLTLYGYPLAANRPIRKEAPAPR
jgi:hypothetical protein